jgi:hypothetical protein
MLLQHTNTVIGWSDSLSLATLVETTNGFTYRYGMETPKTGYMVATEDNEETYDLSKVDLTQVIDSYLDRHCDYVTVPFSHRYVGGWVDAGFLFLDVSECVQNMEDAIILGKQRNQLGIFCLDDFETINL